MVTEVLVSRSEVRRGVALVLHLDVDVWGDSWINTLHGQHGADPLPLPHWSRGFIWLNVEQLETQTCRTQDTTMRSITLSVTRQITRSITQSITPPTTLSITWSITPQITRLITEFNTINMWGPTLSSQVDAAVDGRLCGVGVDDDLSMESHIKRSVDDRSVAAHNVQTLVVSAPPETQQTSSY